MEKLVNRITNFFTKHKILFAFVVVFIVAFLYLSYTEMKEYFSQSDDVGDSFKYKLCLISIFKNETMNLKTWIEHYIHQGVEHIYLIDNDSDDHPMEILKPYIDRGYVSYHFMPEKYQQMKNVIIAMEKENLSNLTEWLIICDLDEFFYGVPDNLSKTLDEFSEYDIIYSNWRMFGTDGLKEHPSNILKSILHREPNMNHTKYIFKPRKVLLNHDTLDHINSVHRLNADDGKSIIENDKIRLNHYPIQSEEFFKKVKMTRGDVNLTDMVRDMKYFHDSDQNKTVKDDVLANITSEYDH